MVQQGPSWPDQFADALGEAGWTDAEIEEATTEVRTRCAHAGQGPRREFGDAASYARRLIRERSGPPPVKRSRPRDILGVIAGVVGIVLSALTADAAHADTELALRSGGVVIAAVAIGLGVLGAVWSTQVMSTLTRGGPIPVLIVALGSLAVVMLGYLATPTFIITVTWPVAALAALAALGASVVASWPHRPRRQTRSSQIGGTDSAPAALQWLMVFLYPLAALVLVAFNGIT
ncbi:MAG: hypothetical protein WA962_09165 [Ornithinimicrobium sp.]